MQFSGTAYTARNYFHIGGENTELSVNLDGARAVLRHDFVKDSNQFCV